MSTVKLVLDANPDGTVHIPLPAELREGKIEVTATLRAANGTAATKPHATPEMLQKRMEAFDKLREMNPYRDIDDPVAWQKGIRKDRPLPGRE